MNILEVLTTLLIVFTATVSVDEREVHGRVVDQAGQPVQGATVASFWYSNGKRLHDDGSPLDPAKNKQDAQLFWQHEGEMEPSSQTRTTQTDAQGSFTVNMGLHSHTLLVMDSSRQHGALATLPKGKESDPLEIRLGPLVRVHGTMTCAQNNQTPNWCIADLSTADDPTRPIDNTRLAVCGTYAGRFAFSLPPGNYDLYTYGTSTDNGVEDLKLIHPTKLELRADNPDVDLGEIRLPSYQSHTTFIEKAKADGTWFDYTKHYGEPPPHWNVVDARGVNKDVQLSAYRGKWVLLFFWGLSCPVCLRDDIPRLMKFYEAHEAQRDQFEILSICIDADGESKTLAELDHRLEPIVKNVWDGKTPTFPTLFDPSYKTFDSFGLPGLGVVILIVPDGNMVAGDETTLAEKLK
jgi:thiol-disulfide isomerase/thioredoxin